MGFGAGWDGAEDGKDPKSVDFRSSLLLLGCLSYSSTAIFTSWIPFSSTTSVSQNPTFS